MFTLFLNALTFLFGLLTTGIYAAFNQAARSPQIIPIAFVLFAISFPETLNLLFKMALGID